MVTKLQPIRKKLLHGRPCHVPWSNNFATRMLTRDLFAVANLLVAPQNHQRNCHQHNTHSRTITRFVFGRSSGPDPARGAHDDPETPYSVGMGNSTLSLPFSHLLTTLTVHHTFTVPFQAQNSPFPQVFSIIVC